MPIAIEVFERERPPEFQIDINGGRWAIVCASELAAKLAEIGRAYATGGLAEVLASAPPPSRA